MTAPNGAVVFNAGGDDNAASGLGPAVAVSGTGASTDGSTTVSVLTDDPDLSGVSVGDMLWVGSSSGRQFSVISAVDNSAGVKTITTDDAWVNTEPGRDWGVGGKRQSWEVSKQIFEDLKDEWIVETESDQTTSTSYDFTTTTTGIIPSTRPRIRGSAGSRKTVTMNGNLPTFYNQAPNMDGIRFENLAFRANGASNVASAFEHRINNNGLRMTFVDCEMGDASFPLAYGVVAISGSYRFFILEMSNCAIHDCLISGVEMRSSSNSLLNIRACSFYDNAQYAIRRKDVGSGCRIIDCAFSNNGGNSFPAVQIGFEDTTITGNSFYNSGTHSIECTIADFVLLTMANNIFSVCGGYHLAGNFPLLDDKSTIAYHNNLWFGNTQGDVESGNMTLGEDAVEADPQYVDPANNDLRLQQTSPAKATGYPGDLGGTGVMIGYRDIGVLQREEPTGGGGGGLLVHPGMTGGIRG